MSINDRLNKLEREANLPTHDIFFFDDGNGLTPEQKAQAAEAEARGGNVTIFSWGKDGN